jgi:murein hydrolase activator
VKTSKIQNSKLNIQNLFFLVFLFPFFPVFSLHAQDYPNTPIADTSQLNKNLKQNKKDLAAMKKKLAAEKEKERLARLKEKNILGQLQKTDQMLGKLRREKNVNKQDLQETQMRLSRLQGEIKDNREQAEQSRHLLKQRLRALYRMSARTPFLGGVLDSESFSDLARKLKFEMLLAQSNQKLLSQTVLNEERLEQDLSQWSEEEKRGRRIENVLGRQEINYSVQRKDRTLFLASIRHEKSLREKTIEDLSEATRELQSKIGSLLRQAVEAGKRPAYASSGAGLMVKRGKIQWPVSGRIIQPFGRYRNTEFKADVDNSGIQIQAPLGTPIRAVEGGRVLYADWFKGYGKLVILDHGRGYYSLYAQAAELDVSEGQTVKAGQVIGTVGDTGSLVGSSLYFEIRKNGVPQDPTLWLTHRM